MNCSSVIYCASAGLAVPKSLSVSLSLSQIKLNDPPSINLRRAKPLNDKKKVPQFPEGLNLKSATTYSPTIAVPSALSGLTSLFGKGRGGTPTLKPPKS